MMCMCHGDFRRWKKSNGCKKKKKKKGKNGKTLNMHYVFRATFQQ